MSMSWIGVAVVALDDVDSGEDVVVGSAPIKHRVFPILHVSQLDQHHRLGSCALKVLHDPTSNNNAPSIRTLAVSSWSEQTHWYGNMLPCTYRVRTSTSPSAARL